MKSCEMCGTEISDDDELCENCKNEQNNTSNLDESYLDDLLNSIVSEEPIQNSAILKSNKIEETDQSMIDTLEEETSQQENEDSNVDNLNDILGDLLDNLDDTGNLQMEEDKENEFDFEEENLVAEQNEISNMDDVSDGDDVSDIDDLLSIINSVGTTEEHVIEEDNNSKENGSFEEDGQHDYGEEDIFSLDDMFSDFIEEEPKEEISNKGTNVGDAFSDALGAVTSYQDEALIDLLPEDNKPPKKKIGIIKKIFGNIHDENQIEEDSTQSEGKSKKKKQKKSKKNNPIQVEQDLSIDDATDSDKKSASKKNNKQKKEKKIKKIKKTVKVVEQLENEDQGKINKVGAIIVFVFLTICTIFLLVEIQFFSYSQSIKNATGYFDKQKYTNAYNQVRGINVKAKDEETYNKIITVMYVNKQLNSYNNYYNLDMYDQALDSLLKGLKRYDKYIAVAKKMGIKSDMDYVRNQILAELNQVFGVDEKDAYQIINNEVAEDYSSHIKQVISDIKIK